MSLLNTTNSFACFRSTSFSDIYNSIGKNHWTHTCNSNKIKVGDTVIIFANKAECKNRGIDFKQQIVVAGKFTDHEKLKTEDMNWPTNMDGSESKGYFHRFNLEDVELYTFDELPEKVKESLDTAAQIRGARYIP